MKIYTQKFRKIHSKVSSRGFLATVKIKAVEEETDKLNTVKYNILKYDNKRRDYIIKELSLSEIFPK